ncbi:MAG: helix-turn-helix domain-containing protein [Oscillospiraceae bacterium]|nr:helix-turn-helix domain-containing protein [Oscillospiraceae bacterium]
MSTVGSRLRDLRKSLNLSQNKLCEIANLKQSTLNRYEHDGAEAPYAVMLWYADYFDVSLDYLFCRTDNPQGKLYEFKPKIPNEDIRQFIEMCFDKDSPMSERLKQSIITMFEEGKKD